MVYTSCEYAETIGRTYPHPEFVEFVEESTVIDGSNPVSRALGKLYRQAIEEGMSHEDAEVEATVRYKAAWERIAKSA
jgi:hypothetical protein